MLPILYQNKDFILYSYPLLMGIGWGIAYQIFFSLMTLPRWKSQILFWGVFLSAWLGAKLFFIFTAAKNSDLLLSSSFWTGGGFVFYGGLIAGFLFVCVFKVFFRNTRLSDLWPVLPALTFGHAVGRIGCLLAGCCYGKETNAIWGIYLHDHYRHPTQLIEAIGLAVIGYAILKSKRPKIFLLPLYMISYGTLRFFIEHLRGDLVRGTWGFLTPSQWISLILIFAGVAVIFINKSRRLA